MSDEAENQPVEIALDALSAEALAGLVEEFVTRDGTDYGARERSTEEKVAAVHTQLAAREALVVFDPESESVQIVLAREWEGRSRA